MNTQPQRHLVLAWASGLASRWPQINAAIDSELRHDAGALSDPGTECVLGQVLAAPTRHHTGYPTPQEQRMSEGHHLPAALTQPGELPPAIPFPARPANARAMAPSKATVERWARQARQIEDARAEGRSQGLKLGDKQGWRRGVITGAVCAVVLTSLGWSAYLSIAAPEVAPPSAMRPAVPATL